MTPTIVEAIARAAARLDTDRASRTAILAEGNVLPFGDHALRAAALSGDAARRWLRASRLGSVAGAPPRTVDVLAAFAILARYAGVTDPEARRARRFLAAVVIEGVRMGYVPGDARAALPALSCAWREIDGDDECDRFARTIEGARGTDPDDMLAANAVPTTSRDAYLGAVRFICAGSVPGDPARWLAHMQPAWNQRHPVETAAILAWRREPDL